MKDRSTEAERARARAAEAEEERLVRAVLDEFEARREARRPLERSWELNMNFLAGNQYCDIGPAGELEEEQPRFYWQSRRVFNHIAPAIDTRCAKLARVRPVMSVRAATGEESDMRTAKIAADVLHSVSEECALDDAVSRATAWSETCGTAFYKVYWDARGGKSREGGQPEGAVCVAALSPFEIYPQDLACERVEDQPSIMHVRAVPVQEIREKYGLSVAEEDIDEFSFTPRAASSNDVGGSGAALHTVRRGCAKVIEYYMRPNEAFPNGRLTVIAGNRLAYCGDLPYVNGENGARTYPFVKQCAVPLSGAFFGGSLIDRMIPVQRAFNAVKNRKHEFLNRLTMGVLAVEDGSVDTEELLEEGLAPGKVLVYRRGSQPPRLLSADSMPGEFQTEEERLLDEFILVSGVSELSSTTQNRTHVTSATGLQLLIDLDDTRLAVTTDSIRRAIKQIGRFILRLMRQFAGHRRLLRMAGDGRRAEWISFSASDLSSDDVVFETDVDETSSPSKRRSLLYELVSMGLLAGEDGKIPAETRSNLLEALGFGGLDGSYGLLPLHKNKAAEENRRLLSEEVSVDRYDDDAVHIAEHTRFLLSDEFRRHEEAKERFTAHLRGHEEQARRRREETAR